MRVDVLGPLVVGDGSVEVRGCTRRSDAPAVFERVRASPAETLGG